MKNRKKVHLLSVLSLVAVFESSLRLPLYFDSFSLISTVWAGSGIELPPLETDEDKLKFLIWIKKKIPALFSDSAQYNINLMDILNDQKNLVNELKKHPEYEKAFQDRHYLDITITPSVGGIEVNQVKLKDGVVDEWKKTLLARLEQWAKERTSVEGQSISDALKQDILQRLNQSEPTRNTNKTNETARQFATLIGADGIKGKMGKGAYQYEKTATLLEKLDVVERILNENQEIKNKHELENQLTALITAEKNKPTEFKPKDLVELYLALKHRERAEKKSQNLEGAQKSLTQLSEEDLHYFSDEHDVLDPAVKKLSQDTQKQKTLLGGLTSNIKKFADQTEGKVIKATSPVHLREVAPREAIFRGCTGGDCSSQYSFPYPNDPNERVFFISDQDENLKGYVSSTVVDSNGKESLYVITISGNRVNAGDTELVLRGLNQEKEKLGVDQILLPNEQNINGLINFPEIRGVYQQHIQSQPGVPITYENQSIREAIEIFESKNNEGRYDHRANNKVGVIFKERTNKTVKTQSKVQSLPDHPFNNLEMSRSDVLEFALDMHHSKRQELVKRIVALPVAKITQEEFDQGVNVLKNEDHPLSIESFKEKLKEFKLSWGVDLDNKQYLTQEGTIRASNAFEKAHIENTAKLLLKEIKAKGSTPYEKLINDHQDHLNKTESYNKYKTKLLAQLDSEEFEKKLEVISKVKLAKLHLNNEFFEKTLSHPRVGIRIKAASSLSSYRGPDGHTLFEKALSDQDAEVRKSAAFVLSGYHGPDGHTLFEKAFSDQNVGVRMNAASALSGYHGPDGHTLFEKALSDQDALVRMSAADSLMNCKGPDGHTLFEKALSDQNAGVRINAADSLMHYKGPDAPTLFEKAFSDQDEWVRKSAAASLMNYLGPDAQLKQKLAPILVGLLKNKNSEIRNEIFEVIKEMYPEFQQGNEAGLTHLKEYLNSSTCTKPIDEVISIDNLSAILKYLKTQAGQ
jgi:HEAT repeat protein